MITPHETWNILDSTKIAEYMNCPRRYFFKFIMGWVPKFPSIHLEFGIAWHEAMRVLLEDHTYDVDSVDKAYKAFVESFRKTFPEEMDAELAPKIPANAFDALLKYIIIYEQDIKDYDVLHVEVPGTIMVEDTLVAYKIDAVLRHKESNLITLFEHKTASNINTQWMMKWKQSIQLGMYTHMMYSTYEEKDVGEIIVNGVSVKNPPRVKKDGTLYANEKGTEFLRVPIKKSLRNMNDWYMTISNWISDISKDTNSLKINQYAIDDHMISFRKNTEACSQYFGCPYTDYCIAWNNPTEKECPVDFKVSHWNPLEHKND